MRRGHMIAGVTILAVAMLLIAYLFSGRQSSTTPAEDHTQHVAPQAELIVPNLPSMMQWHMAA